MNDMAYLQQISAQNRPAPSSPFSSLFEDRRFRIAGIFAVIAIIIVIALSVITAAMPKPATADAELSRLYLRSNSLLETVKTYNSSVKSSELRAAGASLTAVLTDLNSSTATSLEKSSAALASAKLNGLLDRSYASELSYQISYLILLEDSALSKTSNAAISDYLTTSRASLVTLNATFSNFSETR